MVVSHYFRRALLASSFCLTSAWVTNLYAATPKVEEALALTPVQKDVEFDRPSAADMAKCTIKPQKSETSLGWIVRDEEGKILRRFVDSNNDNVVDLWCYYQEGIEVYRDIDSNFDGKVDECRWLNTGGCRWGMDTDQNGKIDKWKLISAEETTAEVVRALATGDAARFARVTLSAEELEDLGLGTARHDELKAIIDKTPERFKQLVGKKVVTSETQWVQFGALQPGVVPSGTDGSTKDLVVYENVIALTETGDKSDQLQIGTLIRMGDSWRVIDVPASATGDTADSGGTSLFFASAAARPLDVPEETPSGLNDETQKFLQELEQLEAQAAQAKSPRDLGEIDQKKINLVVQLIEATEGSPDQAIWQKQLADILSAGAQTGSLPDGVERLEAHYNALEDAQADKDTLGYVKFRCLAAAYGAGVQKEGVDIEKLHATWLQNLKDYVQAYPKSPDTAEALFQLATSEDFGGAADDALAWYERLVIEFPDSPSAPKSKGAITRLNSIGKPLPIKGQLLDGAAFDSAKLKGKLVLVHYWASDSDPCKADLAQIKELHSKFGKDGFLPVGICLDTQKASATEFVRTNRIAWPQLYEQGGMDSRLANELGVFTLPTMLLIDKRGKVVSRNLHISELEQEIKDALR